MVLNYNVVYLTSAACDWLIGFNKQSMWSTQQNQAVKSSLHVWKFRFLNGSGPIVSVNFPLLYNDCNGEWKQLERVRKWVFFSRGGDWCFLYRNRRSHLHWSPLCRHNGTSQECWYNQRWGCSCGLLWSTRPNLHTRRGLEVTKKLETKSSS